jgi:hypothetical protein
MTAQPASMWLSVVDSRDGLHGCEAAIVNCATYAGSAPGRGYFCRSETRRTEFPARFRSVALTICAVAQYKNKIRGFSVRRRGRVLAAVRDRISGQSSERGMESIEPTDVGRYKSPNPRRLGLHKASQVDRQSSGAWHLTLIRQSSA